MGEFAAQITHRLHGAAEALRLAKATGDTMGVQTHDAELDDLRRLAAEHGVELPESA